MFLSGNMDEKMLDTLRKVEISELHHCGGERYTKHTGSGTKSRRYRRPLYVQSLPRFIDRHGHDTGNLHASRARTFDRGGNEESPGASSFHETVS